MTSHKKNVKNAYILNSNFEPVLKLEKLEKT